ncbi:MAG: ABC transporter ATP-binding protein [Fuerstiella sp.]|nr:ABC transporter ATP-binding protein [Fuerstiella sp.]
MSDSDFLHAENVTKLYGADTARHEALRGISFAAERGEFVAIRGPSGCGKSTLLHILGAMDSPTDGNVWLNGRRLDTLGLDELAIVRRRYVGFIFQSFNLLPTLTVQENVSLPLLLDGVADREASERSISALADVGLQSRTQHLPSELSGGEMQRAAIARALAIDPDLVIADEPTGSLDSANGLRVLELLANLNATRNITVVMATHSADAAAFAKRVLHVKDGQIEKEEGADVLSSPV